MRNSLLPKFLFLFISLLCFVACSDSSNETAEERQVTYLPKQSVEDLSNWFEDFHQADFLDEEYCQDSVADKVLVCEVKSEEAILDSLILNGKTEGRITRVNFELRRSNTGVAGMVFETEASELVSQLNLDVGFFDSGDIQNLLEESAYSLNDKATRQLEIDKTKFIVEDRQTTFGRTLTLTIFPSSQS